jgi:hypothetical protein
VEQIQKTGLSMRQKPQVPFGVRAIQSGIEVDGIWISRPGTPNSHSPVGSSTLTLTSSDQDLKRKLKLSEKLSETTTNTSESSSSSTVEGDENSPPRSPALRAQSTYRPKHAPTRSSLRVMESYNAESLNKLEGGPDASPELQTYIPTSPFTATHRVRSDGASTCSSEGSIRSSHSSQRSNQPRVSLFPDTSVGRKLSYTRGVQDTLGAPKASVASSLRVPTGPQTPPIAPSTRSYTGETHVNRASRKVNAGFEVLPAGTFGSHPSHNRTPSSSDADSERGNVSRTSSNTMYSRPLNRQNRENSR